MNICKQLGFTLVEFLAVLAIAALFTTLVIPGYREMIQNNKVVSATNKLSASLQLARMEAVKRGVEVGVCPTANAAFSACGSTGQWSNGWIVFVDEDSDDAIDASSDLIKISQGFSTDATVTTTSSIVTYDASGFSASGATTFTLSASGCTGNNARVLTVSSTGRVTIAVAAFS